MILRAYPNNWYTSFHEHTTDQDNDKTNTGENPE
jgi:hypothetical protein